MSWLRVWIAGGLLTIAAAAAAQDAGQADLDQALELRVNAESAETLNQIIQLCESAIEKGLSDENRAFAEQMLSGTLLQRATILAQLVQSADLNQPQLQARALAWRKQALADADRVIAYDASQAQAHLLIARMEVFPGGDRQRARRELDETIKLAEDDAPLKSLALSMRAGLAETPEERLRDLDEAVRLQPESAVPLRARGVTLLQQGEIDKGLDDLRKALELEPADADTHELLAAALAESGKLEEALATIDRAIEQGAKGPEIHFLRARLLIAEKKYNDALKDLDRVIEARPGFVPALRIRAAILADEQRETEAILDLESARQHSNDPELLAQLGALYGATEQLGRSIACYNDALAQDAENWTLYMLRADAYLAVGRHKEALDDYAQAHRLKPDDSGILNNFAWLLATSPDDELRDGKRSIELATEACKLTDYQAPHILSTLAAGYAETGDFEKAIEWSTKAVDLATDALKEPLQKELASYKEGKPWREKQEKPLEPPPMPAKAEEKEEAAEEEKKAEETEEAEK